MKTAKAVLRERKRLAKISQSYELRLLRLVGQCATIKAALRFVLDLRDRADDGKWDAKTIARLDKARELASELAILDVLRRET